MPAWVVHPDQAGERLDRFLATNLPASRSRVRQLLASGAVSLDHRVMRENDGGRALREGGEIEVAEDVPGLLAEGGDALEVLAEGAGWVAVNKPAGIPVHPLALGETGTLLNAVLERYPAVRGVGDEGELRSGVVHRLDVDTSGAVLFALEQARWLALRSAFTEHRVTKRYRALVSGRLSGAGRERATLAVTRHRPAYVEVVGEGHPDGRRCSLDWRVLDTGSDASEIEINLHTGFLHQVRVMMAARGHALLGDTTYADELVASRAPRQMLHAVSIAVDDIAAEAPLPEDYTRCREACLTR